MGKDIKVIDNAEVNAENPYADNGPEYNRMVAAVADAICDAQTVGYQNAGVTCLPMDAKGRMLAIEGIMGSLKPAIAELGVVSLDIIADGIEMADADNAHLAATVASAMFMPQGR